MEKIRPVFFYIVFFLFCLAFTTIADGYDYDLWARLIAGMSFVKTGIILKQDFLSYMPVHQWIDHEWGSSVIFYLVQHLFANAGILLLQASLAFLIFFFISKIIVLRGVKTTSAYNFLFYFFAFQAMSQTINQPIRCQMFSFLFFAIFLYILELSRNGKEKYLWALPVLMLFWNNLHGGCVSGIGLIIIYIIGEFLNKQPVKKYFAPFLATVAVLPINPWGFSYLQFLLSATTMKRPEVIEWWGLFSKYHMYDYVKFKIFALVLILTQFASFKELKIKSEDKTKLLVLAVTLILAIEHVKLIPFFVISACAFLYDDFYTLFNKLTKNFFDKIALAKEIVVYSVIFIFIFSNLRTNAFEPLLNWNKYPLREIEFIKINDIKGNLLINFGQGSYAAYKLYPNNKIFMDGRYEEVYYDYMVPMLKKFYLMNAGWEEVLIKFPPDVMVIEKFYPVYGALNSSKDWKLVFEGKFFGVFVPAKTAGTNYQEPSSDLKDYKNSLFDTDINFVLKSANERK